MAKPKKRGRPTGRNPVIAVRVEPPLQAEIAADAKAAQRTMAAEIDGLIRQALSHRKRISLAAQAIEAATLTFLLSGERYALDNGVTGLWTNDFHSRRTAAVAACLSLITNFVSSDPQDQALAVEDLKGRVWTAIINRPRQEEKS